MHLSDKYSNHKSVKAKQKASSTVTSSIILLATLAQTAAEVTFKDLAEAHKMNCSPALVIIEP